MLKVEASPQQLLLEVPSRYALRHDVQSVTLFETIQVLRDEDVAQRTVDTELFAYTLGLVSTHCAHVIGLDGHRQPICSTRARLDHRSTPLRYGLTLGRGKVMVITRLSQECAIDEDMRRGTYDIMRIKHMVLDAEDGWQQERLHLLSSEFEVIHGPHQIEDLWHRACKR